AGWRITGGRWAANGSPWETPGASARPGGQLLVVFPPGGVQQVRPGFTLGTATRQRPPLPFGHSSPHAEADPVVQRFGKTFGTHRTPHADQLGPVLLRPSNEQAIRIGRS